MTTRRVVVIDSGIDGAHPALRGHRVVAGPAFDGTGPVSAEHPGAPAVDRLGHGTAVAATIVRFLPPAAAFELVALPVFGDRPTCDFAAVLLALRHALTLSPTIVNLSLGTTSLRYRAALAPIVAAARAQGVRVVAPASYGGLPCDPGAIDGVEAVVADANVLPMLPELRPHGRRLVWFASPLPPPDADGVRRLVARGESLAVAAVTGLLLRQAVAR